MIPVLRFVLSVLRAVRAVYAQPFDSAESVCVRTVSPIPLRHAAPYGARARAVPRRRSEVSRDGCRHPFVKTASRGAHWAIRSAARGAREGSLLAGKPGKAAASGGSVVFA